MIFVVFWYFSKYDMVKIAQKLIKKENDKKTICHKNMVSDFLSFFPGTKGEKGIKIDQGTIQDLQSGSLDLKSSIST